MSQPWLSHYSKGVPHTVTPDRYTSLVDMLDQACVRHASAVACSAMGRDIRYGQVDTWGRSFAAWLQSAGVVPGTRVALMMPNVPAYLVALLGTLRAGCVVVNVSPLYTAEELRRVLKDSGAQVLVVLENFAHTYAAIQDEHPVAHVVVTGAGDLLGGLKSWVVNLGARYIKRMVPAWHIPQARTLAHVLRVGASRTLRPPPIHSGDLAVLQYTGGTTGAPKGAMLTHRNLVANVLQVEAVTTPVTQDADTPLVMLTALPLYHIFALTVCGFYTMYMGMRSLMIINPRDLSSIVHAWRRTGVNLFPGVNTLFNALCHEPAFARLDFSGLRLALGGGTAVQPAIAQRWQDLTGTPLVEGYGLSETSPLAVVNPTDGPAYTGAIGLPAPSTDVIIVDDAGHGLPIGERGEIAIRGPQVMRGYWRNDEETRAAMTPDGYFRSGDIGTMDARGYITLVDRKKDLILVSGFNVYPNEVEAVVAEHPGVRECAVVAMAHPHSGEAVRLFVVRREPGLTAETLASWCRARLAGYKCPREIVFRDSLPKSNVGKILRRELRD